MKFKTLKDLNVKSKTVLLRAPLNVPIEGAKVTDALRLESVLPTIKYLIKERAKVVLLSHHSHDGQSLAPVAPVLGRLLGRPVRFEPDCIGPEVAAMVRAMKDGDVLMLENLRFHAGEKANDPKFAGELAALGDAYVDDDFTNLHRSHASMVGVPKLLPHAAGLQVELEVKTITEALEKPKRPLFAIIGGAKISTKLALAENLLKRVDFMLIGGAMANTFLAADDLEIGKSIYESGEVPAAGRMIKQAARRSVSLILPNDVVVATKLTKTVKTTVKPASAVGKRDIIGDVGPDTVARARDALAVAGTVIWNGPLGITELPPFAKSSIELAKAVGHSHVKSIVGGGDTAAFVDAAGLHDQFSFVSTGGGASLNLMAGLKLPGLEALK